MTAAPAVPAVVLLSGGLDSATTLAIARDRGFACHAISFDYAQRHRTELDAARAIADALDAASHRTVCIDLRAFGGSALTDDIDVPKSAHDTAHTTDDIPITYVPARNLVFLSLATALAETLGAADLFIGVNAVDYSGYPDCRPEFVSAFEHAATLGTKQGIEGRPLRVHAPLVEMTKADIIRRGAGLGVDFALTRSCYDPDDLGRACGECDSCRIRRTGFNDADLPDPTVYAPTPPHTAPPTAPTQPPPH